MPTHASRRSVLIGVAALGALAVVVLIAWLVTRPGEPSGSAEPSASTAERTDGAQVSASAAPEIAIGEAVSEEECPDSEFTCITLRVPLDHFAGAGGPTLDVTFGLLRATGDESLGAFVTATGGPGSSGLAVADGYTSVLDPAIPESYDIVFYDQRGIGQSGPIQCPDAALAYYLTDSDDPDVYAADADRFVDDCIAESGVSPDDLPYYSTRQAVEDLELFRAWLGVEKLQLYGESYGTQFAQTYALAHPDRIEALFLDGPVDLALEGLEYYEEQTRAFAETLELTLAACSEDPACDADAGADAPGAYDALIAELQAGPVALDFVTASGEVEERELSLGLLESAAATAMYSPIDRLLFQRALGYAARGDLLPVARLGYTALGQDPETLEAIPDPSWSDALFYAVECTDYRFPGDTEEERVEAFFSAAERAGTDDLRLGAGFFGDLPCAFWPSRPDAAERPEALTDTPYPVWVLASDVDPATPFAGAERIFDRLSDGYLIVQEGGPHVIFGRGDPCPDEPVTEFLLSGTLPESRTIECAVDIADPYVPLPEPSVEHYPSALEAMAAVDREINYTSDFWNWDGVEPLDLGCLYGGSMRYESTDEGFGIELEGCEMIRGLPLTGKSVIDDVEGTISLSVTAPADTDLEYRHESDGALSVEGTWQGEAVSEDSPAP